MIKSIQSEQSEQDKFDEIAKRILLLNPSVRTSVGLVELLCKHGIFKATFKETKTAYITGGDEVEIEFGKRLQNVQMLMRAWKE